MSAHSAQSAPFKNYATVCEASRLPVSVSLTLRGGTGMARDPQWDDAQDRTGPWVGLRRPAGRSRRSCCPRGSPARTASRSVETGDSRVQRQRPEGPRVEPGAVARIQRWPCSRLQAARAQGPPEQGAASARGPGRRRSGHSACPWAQHGLRTPASGRGFWWGDQARGRQAVARTFGTRQLQTRRPTEAAGARVAEEAAGRGHPPRGLCARGQRDPLNREAQGSGSLASEDGGVAGGRRLATGEFQEGARHPPPARPHYLG